MPVLLLRGLEGFSMTDFSHKALQRESWHSEICISVRSGGQRHASSVWNTHTHLQHRPCSSSADRQTAGAKHHHLLCVCVHTVSLNTCVLFSFCAPVQGPISPKSSKTRLRHIHSKMKKKGILFHLEDYFSLIVIKIMSNMITSKFY